MNFGGEPSRRSICLFWRETKQRPEFEIFDETGSGQGNARERIRKGTQREELAKGDVEGQSTTDSRRDQSAWERESWSSEGRPVKMSQHSSWLVEISRRMHVSFSLPMHRECGVTEPPFLHLSWPKPLLFVYSLFFFPHSLSCISCGHKEMCDTPIRTTRWITGQDRIVSTKLSTGAVSGCFHKSSLEPLELSQKFRKVIVENGDLTKKYT